MTSKSLGVFPTDRRACGGKGGAGGGPRPLLLRLSITDRCNLRCRYCMPAGGVAVERREDLLGLEDLARLVGWLAGELPVGRVKLTGGEPLVRRGVTALVRELAGIAGIHEVSMTTNGTRLPEMARGLAGAGLARVSVSLDTLDPERYARLTRGGRLGQALAGLDAALQAGLIPVKLNAVLLRSWWREDVPRLLDLAADRGVEVRFIELMRTGTEAAWAEGELVPAAEVREWLAGRAEMGPLPHASGPARRTRVRWGGRDLVVGWITPQSHPFCSECVRLRLDARGRLRRCLMDPVTFDLAGALERGEAAAREELDEYLAGKRAPAAMASELPMVSVGG